ncbi:hypothetical protein Bca101_043391 [Brassica carinata]
MDEVPSDHVAYLEKLIPDQHPFSKTMWPGGVSTEPFIKKLKVTKRQRTNKQSTPLKKSLKPQLNRKKSSSKRKQTRISNYFTRSQPTSFTIEDLQEIVNGLTEKYNIIHSEAYTLKRIRGPSYNVTLRHHIFKEIAESSKELIKLNPKSEYAPGIEDTLILTMKGVAAETRVE